MRIVSFGSLYSLPAGTVFGHWIPDGGSLNMYVLDEVVVGRHIWVYPLTFFMNEPQKLIEFEGYKKVCWDEKKEGDRLFVIWELEELQELRSMVMRAISLEMKKCILTQG